MKDSLCMMPAVAAQVGKKRGMERPSEKELANEQSWKDFSLPMATFYIFYILGKMALRK